MLVSWPTKWVEMLPLPYLWYKGCQKGGSTLKTASLSSKKWSWWWKYFKISTQFEFTLRINISAAAMLHENSIWLSYSQFRPDGWKIINENRQTCSDTELSGSWIFSAPASQIGVIRSMTPNCHTLKKLQKSVTICEHLPKMYYFWTIIKQKQKKRKKKCDNLVSWPVLQNWPHEKHPVKFYVKVL